MNKEQPIGKKGIELIALERERQISEEGWTAEHDAEHEYGELAIAASCYAIPQEYRPLDLPPLGWPWDINWWKPSSLKKTEAGKPFIVIQGRIMELQKAGALIAAEIDRLSKL